MKARVIPLPAHTHDCKKCEFITSVEVENDNGVKHRTDFYLSCQRETGSLWIARFSSEGSDYSTIQDLNHLFMYYTFLQDRLWRRTSNY